MLSTSRFGSMLSWLLLTATFLAFSSSPAWAAPVLHSANQSVPVFDFHLNLPQIANIPTPQKLIFADDFESEDFSSWSSSKTTEDALVVTPEAALVGTQGLQVTIVNTASVYLTDDLPKAESRYQARFYFDPNSINMAEGDSHFIFYGYNSTPDIVLRIQFRISSGSYQLRASVLDDSAAFVNTDWSTISDAPHEITVDWQAAATDANDGSLTLSIDDVPTTSVTDADNDTQRIDRVRIGAVAGIDVGTQGSYYFDDFQSQR